MSYNWISASTAEGRERLKKLADSGCQFQPEQQSKARQTAKGQNALQVLQMPGMRMLSFDLKAVA